MPLLFAEQFGNKSKCEPHRYDQPPNQNETSDDSGQNEVQRKQSDPTAQGAAARDDPETQPPDAKRQPAEYPWP